MTIAPEVTEHVLEDCAFTRSLDEDDAFDWDRDWEKYCSNDKQAIDFGGAIHVKSGKVQITRTYELCHSTLSACCRPQPRAPILPTLALLIVPTKSVVLCASLIMQHLHWPRGK